MVAVGLLLGMVGIDVTDSGSGIPQEQLQEQVQAQLQEQQDQLLAQLQEQQQAQLQEQQEQLLAQLEEQQQAQLQEQQNRLDQIASRLEDLQLTQRDLRSEVQEAKTAAARGDVNALMLSEVGYLLRLADHKLQVWFKTDQPVYAVEAERHFGIDKRTYDPMYSEDQFMPVDTKKELKTNTGPLHRFFSTNEQSFNTQFLT